MAKFLHVAFGFEGKPVAIEKIQKVFDVDDSTGWARYAPNCWIVHTNESPTKLADRLHAVCRDVDSIFVCELNIDNHNGYLHKVIWDWIRDEEKKL